MAQENNELYTILQEKRVQVVERQQIQDLAGIDNTCNTCNTCNIDD